MTTGRCPACRRVWTGHSEAHCSNCCSHFTSDSSFDRHLGPPDADPACFDPASLKVKQGTRKGEPLFEQIHRAHGPVWRIIDHRRHPFQNALRPLGVEISGPNGAEAALVMPHGELNPRSRDPLGGGLTCERLPLHPLSPVELSTGLGFSKSQTPTGPPERFLLDRLSRGVSKGWRSIALADRTTPPLPRPSPERSDNHERNRK